MSGPVWAGLCWPASTVAILASGSSLTLEQCEQVREWRAAAPNRRAIAINTTFRRAPWADVLYGCDSRWWQQHIDEARATFAGELWTQSVLNEPMPGLKVVTSVRKTGLGTELGVIHQGGNSGYQAINLAFQFGARRIVLLGFDMAGPHWHGAHGKGLSNPAEYLFAMWRPLFAALAKDLLERDVDVVNCSPETRLTAFRTGILADELS